METRTITADLQDTLVELIDLSLQAKHYHWNVTGQEFRGVHLHLDEITDQVRLWYDEVAERMASGSGTTRSPSGWRPSTSRRTAGWPRSPPRPRCPRRRPGGSPTPTPSR
ncbi:MAG: hypothetical protein MUC45_11890 [Actinomycetia bacterium]|nr:hypothetical protein [Actinomycetes bacterium]